MDEPTTALDVVVQREILQQIEELKRDLGFAVLFITHDLSLLIEVADRIAIMYAGEIVELAPAAELRDNPKHPYTQGLMQSFPPLTGPLAAAHRHSGLAARPGAPPLGLPVPSALPALCARRLRDVPPADIQRPKLREVALASAACHRVEDCDHHARQAESVGVSARRPSSRSRG